MLMLVLTMSNIRSINHVKFALIMSNTGIYYAVIITMTNIDINITMSNKGINYVK